MAIYPESFNESVEDISNRLLSNIDDQYDKREGQFIYDVLKAAAIERQEQRKELKETYDRGHVPTSVGEALDHAIGARSPLKRNIGESDEDFRNRYYTWLEEAGTTGNAQDFVKWALSVTGVTWARGINLARGLGTVNVIVSGNLEYITELVEQVQAAIDMKKTQGLDVKVKPVEIITRTFSFKVTGLDQETATAAALNYLSSIGIGGTYSPTKLIAAVINAGAFNIENVEPTAIFTLPVDGMLDPEVIIDE